MLLYSKLWILLETKGMKKTDLKEVISGNTLAKLGKNETVSSTVIEKICAFLKCQPGDIMEYVSEEDIRNTAQEIDKSLRATIETLKAQGVTEEQFAGLLSQAMPNLVKSMFNNENTLNEILDKTLDNNTDN